MRTLIAPWFILQAFLLSLSSSAFALTTLTGEEARRHVGDAKAHFLSGKYTYEILGRSHRDAMYGRFSDATIFNAGGGNFLYPRRKNGDHILVIDAPDGREEEPVTEEAWRQKLANALSDDNPIPTVYLDDSGKEIAVLYIGKGTNVAAKINAGGLLQITLAVPGSKGSGKRRY